MTYSFHVFNFLSKILIKLFLLRYRVVDTLQHDMKVILLQRKIMMNDDYYVPEDIFN